MKIDDWNPETSTKTKYVETRPDGVRIYSHNTKTIAGRFIAVKGVNDWNTAETLEGARVAIVY